MSSNKANYLFILMASYLIVRQWVTLCVSQEGLSLKPCLRYYQNLVHPPPSKYKQTSEYD